MKYRSVTISVKTDTKGVLMIDQMSKAEMDTFNREHPDTRMVLEITALPKERSRRMIGYFYKVIVPKAQKMFYDLGQRLTPTQTERKLIETTPIMTDQKYNGETWISRYREVEELSTPELSELMETIRQEAAEHGYYIEEVQHL